MDSLNKKIEKNNEKINHYNNKLLKNKRNSSLFEILDRCAIAVAVISGFCIFIINPIAIIPCALSLGGSYLIFRKQKNLEKERNDLTVKRGMLLTENDKINWEINQKEKEEFKNRKAERKMTVGISKKTLVKTKSL